MIPFDDEHRESVANDRLAPKGMFRILCVDKWDHEHSIYGDYSSREEALLIAKRNTENAAGRSSDSSIATVYYVYDDQGNYLGGDIHKGE
ncbi:MAG: hypothetical protein ABIK30_04825 [bacterium]